MEEERRGAVALQFKRHPTSIAGISLSNVELGRAIGEMTRVELSEVFLGMLVGFAKEHDGDVQREYVKLPELLGWAFRHTEALRLSCMTRGISMYPDAYQKRYPGTMIRLRDLGEMIVHLRYDQTAQVVRGMSRSFRGKLANQSLAKVDRERYEKILLYTMLLSIKLRKIVRLCRPHIKREINLELPR